MQTATETLTPKAHHFTGEKEHMKKAILLLVCLGLLSFAGLAQAAGIVTFEDLNPGYESNTIIPPAGYGGFNWSPYFYAITKGYHPGSGYDLGCIGYVTGYTAYANDVSFEGVSGQDFFFIGAFITAAWDSTEDVIVKGFLNGSQTHTTTITTHNDQPYWFSFNWSRVDKVEFQPQGQHIAIDNISHCNPVPVPPSLILIGTGLVGLLGLRRRA